MAYYLPPGGYSRGNGSNGGGLPLPQNNINFSNPSTSAVPGTSSIASASKIAEAVYEAKFKVLTQKCVRVKDETDHIYDNLLRSKKLLRKYLHERRLLAEQLERHGDQFCDAEVPQFCDEDAAYELLLSQKRTFDETLGSQPNLPGTSSAKKANSHRAPSGLGRIGSSLDFDGDFISGGSPLPSPAGTPVNGGPPKKKSGGRARRDPAAPRKPVNAYFIFCEQRRVDVNRIMVEERKGVEVDRKEVTRRLSQMWLDLQADERKVFHSMYEQEKARYDQEMKEYMAGRIASGTSPDGIAAPAGPGRPRKKRPAANSSSSLPQTPNSGGTNTPSIPDASPMNVSGFRVSSASIDDVLMGVGPPGIVSPQPSASGAPMDNFDTSAFLAPIEAQSIAQMDGTFPLSTDGPMCATDDNHVVGTIITGADEDAFEKCTMPTTTVNEHDVTEGQCPLINCSASVSCSADAAPPPPQPATMAAGN